MVTRDTAWPPGTPCWVDLAADDVPKARAFYGNLFGWEFEDMTVTPDGYCMGELGGLPVAGLGPKMRGPNMPTLWTTYLASADADKTADAVRSAGGQVLMDPFNFLKAGRVFFATDPGGATFGVWEALVHPGAQRTNEPGTLIWNENMSRQYDENKAFYSAVFGYGVSEIGAGYATLDIEGRPVGGIGKMGADQPPEILAAWGTYFAVPDTDAAVAKVVDLGGRLITPAWDSPYGRMAAVSDDQGAVLALMSITQDQKG
jgi:predicted enzyme related to lactoylglutathione lyase